MNAQRLSLPEESFDAIITDPPYYDNIPYSHLADYFYIWLKRAVGHLYPEHLSTELTPKKQEAVAEPARFGGDKHQARAQYEQMMHQAFEQAHRLLKPGAPLVCVYAHKTTAGWSALADSLRAAGFVITEAWPLDTELKTGYRGLRASFASSIFMVARKREGDGVGNYGRDVRPLLYEIARERVATLRAAGVGGADLVIACVGAGLRAYTQFARVELPNGDELAASTFLDEVQRAVLEVILADVMGVPEAGVGTVDKISQYYVLARYQYGSVAVDFDEANVLARGVGVELDGPDSLTSGPHPLVKKTKTKVEWNDYRARGTHEDLGRYNGREAPLIDVLQRLLWLNDQQPAKIPQFLMQARADVGRLKLVAEALGGRGLAAEPSPGAARDERTEEQKAIGRLLPAWKRVVEEQTQGRLF
jgi:putative DNA methylase